MPDKVRRSIIRNILFLIVILPCAAHGAGLGKFILNSYLGQPFKAEISLVTVKKEEIPSLEVSFAPRDTFHLLNVNYPPFFDTFEFEVEKRADGQFYIKITSPYRVVEPSFSMLVELNWSSGSLIREYTVLLDPPEETPQPTTPTMQVEPVVPSSIKPEPASAEEPDSMIEDLISDEGSLEEASVQKVPPEQKTAQIIPGSVTPKSTPDEELDSIIESLARDEEPAIDEVAQVQEVASVEKPSITTYGPVKSGDTLAKIAREETSYRLQLNQVLVALHRANREAFSGNNMNRLNIGSILRIPDANEVVTISPDVADKEVKMQTANWEAYRQKLAADAASSVPSREESTQTVTGKIATTIQSDATAAQDPSKGVLKLSKGGQLEKSGSEDTIGVQDRIYSIEEDAIASEKTLIEANKRISLLENAMKEDAIAQEKALIETQERIALLEKNIRELRRLLELENPNMAKAQGQVEKNITPNVGTTPPLPKTTNKSAQIETPSEAELESGSIKWQWLLLAIILLIIVLWGWKYWNASKNQTSESTDTY